MGSIPDHTTTVSAEITTYGQAFGRLGNCPAHKQAYPEFDAAPLDLDTKASMIAVTHGQIDLVAPETLDEPSRQSVLSGRRAHSDLAATYCAEGLRYYQVHKITLHTDLLIPGNHTQQMCYRNQGSLVQLTFTLHHLVLGH